jgi:hypothetical protein
VGMAVDANRCCEHGYGASQDVFQVDGETLTLLIPLLASSVMLLASNSTVEVRNVIDLIAIPMFVASVLLLVSAFKDWRKQCKR